MSTDGSRLLGVVLLARHGDREGNLSNLEVDDAYLEQIIFTGFYQDPHTYTPANTAITALGSVSQSIQIASIPFFHLRRI